MTPQLPTAARLYVAFVIVAGATLLVVGIPQATFSQPLLFAALVVLSSLAANLKVSLPVTTSQSTLSVSYGVDFAALLLLGPHETMLVAASSALSQCQFKIQDRTPLYRTLFSMASLIITVQGAGLVYSSLGPFAAGDPITAIARPLVGAATTYFLLNTGLVAMAIALAAGEPMFRTWQRNFLWSAPSYFVGAASAALAAIVVHRVGYWLTPLTFAPLYLTYHSYKVYMGRIEDERRHARETSDLHLATIEALARAIDAKDRTTQTHIRRVQFYATELARAGGLTSDEIQGVKTAALLHDIGKLAVPEHILSKPGPLTQEEFRKIRIHPQVGAEIIAGVPFPYPVAPIVLSHHERWDGKGYPQGLEGEAIPIGARILTIVDYYDAITTDRPYHKAITHESAMTLLQHEAGRALDPALVDIFTRIVPNLMAELAKMEPQRPAAEEPALILGGTTATGLIPAGHTTAYDNIAQAHREIYALYEIAQTLGTSLGVADTMTLVSSKLSHIIPWTGCALFLQDADGESMTCRFAAGDRIAHLVHARVRISDGICGWVARTGKTLVNADPGLTLGKEGQDPGAHFQSAIVCPLYYNDSFIGSIALYHAERNCYNEDHRRLLERVAEQAGAVLHNSIVFEQTQEDSLTDALTALPNRRSLLTHLSRELARASRLKNTLAVLVLDIDGFKSINDTFGHNVGDEALRRVAMALQSSLRPYDLCARYAGDEFVVVLPECSHESAEAKRRELKERVEQVELAVGAVASDRTVGVSVSAGFAIYPLDGDTVDMLLAGADANMYRDKMARRQLMAVPARRRTADRTLAASAAASRNRPVPQTLPY